MENFIYQAAIFEVPTASITFETKFDSSRRHDSYLESKKSHLSVPPASRWLAAGRDISQRELAKEHVPGYLTNRPDSRYTQILMDFKTRTLFISSVSKSLSFASLNRRLEVTSPRNGMFPI